MHDVVSVTTYMKYFILPADTVWRFVAPFGELHLNKPLTADELRKACGYTHQIVTFLV